VVVIDGGRLTCEQIAAVARRGEPVELAPGVADRVAGSHRRAVAATAAGRVYGRSTGVGANRDVAVTDPQAHAESLLRSHATTAGPPVDPGAVRAMLLVRLNQLAAGGSGVHPRVFDGLHRLLRTGPLPEVRRGGAIGMSDLAALAGTALTMSGERGPARPERDPGRVTFGANDVAPFLSSSALTIGEASLTCVDLGRLARAAVVVAALSLTALDGNLEAFDPLVEEITPFPGARTVCRWMRALAGGGRPPARLQDSFALRCLPQVHGPVLDAVHALDEVVRRLTNAAAENPVIRPERGAGVVHHGGFHIAYLALALDATTLAVAQSGAAVLGRLAGLLEPAVPGGPAFLADGSPGASGAMPLEFVAGCALGGLRAAATPASLQTVTLSRGAEDDASFATLAGRQARAAAEEYATLLSCELVAAGRAVRLRGPDAGAVGSGVAAALAACRDLPGGLADRDLTPDLDLARALLDRLGDLPPPGDRPDRAGPSRTEPD